MLCDGTLLQYSCLENPMDGGAWLATVHGVAKSWTRLSDFTHRWPKYWSFNFNISPSNELAVTTGDFPGGSDGKASAYSAGDPGLIPGSGRSPGEGNGNPLQYSCLENPMDGGAWLVTVHGVAKSRTRLSNFTSLMIKRKARTGI